MMWRWRTRFICLPVWRLHSRWNQIILEVPAVNVAILIVIDLLVHSRSQPLRQAAMDLSLNDHGIDDGAAVIHRHEAANMYFTGTTINIYHADVGPEWVGQVGWVVVVDCL